MLQDLVRLTVTRVLHDKILLGLLIVGILSIFVGGFNAKEDNPDSVKRVQAQMKAETGQTASANPTASSAAPVQALEPGLATDFVKWWMTGAMDYATQSALQNHTAAFRWMTPQASEAFQASLWTPEVADGVAHGRIVAAFQPVSVQAAAVNPDGSVVVVLNGTLVTQGNGRPFTQQIQMDLLVKKETEGLRICGIYNRVANLNSNSTY
jgi:hypothetical protein